MIINYIIITLFSVATVLSIAFQMRERLPFKSFWRFDRFGLLPNYSFFAPKPLMQDFRVVFRLTNESKNDEWQELPMYENLSISKTLYNPFKYYNKGMIDICMSLLKEMKNLKEEQKDFIQVSANYLGIFNVIKKNIDRKEAISKRIEFAIISTEDFKQKRKIKILFRSFQHNFS